MDKENLNYLPQYQKLLFENKQNVVDVNRKCLIQTFSASLELLDNNESLELLEINLDKYTKALNNKLKKEQNVNRPATNNKRSCLNEVDVKALLNLPSCSSSHGFTCTPINNFTEKDFCTFMKSFEDKPDENTIKTRKFARSFTPQCANREAKPISLTPPETITESTCFFRTAREELDLQNLRQGNNHSLGGGLKRKLGYRRSVQSKFVSPMLNSGSNEELTNKNSELPIEDERLKNIDPKMVELIRSEIMDNGQIVQWHEIAGLESAKTAIQEAVVWPLLRPDIFTGLRKPPKGILLFGPPGTGKTLIGKCVASQSKSTFFSISASSLTSKWIGDGEKMVRALFAVALCHQPAVIFIDEVDSLLSQRSEMEHECTRRLKTEFLVRLDGATTCSDERILVIGATNRPQELDEAARRRFVKRLYIPLPEHEARVHIVTNLMSKERHNLTENEILKIAELSDGYSGADMKNLCSEASLGPIRSIDIKQMETIEAHQVRAVNMQDFTKALTLVRSSVSPSDLTQYIEWNQTYGSGSLI